ncbi:MAG TPA: hypothetical protein VME22_00285 [Solirubrobacteraceae bacterium]|nr:hypothetical protein [Solirubrobacteraceae bacterium]
MLLTASTRAPLSAGSLVLIVCFCSATLAFGIAHYRGWHRQWIGWLPFDANFFGPAWFGACGLLVVLAEEAGRIGAWLEAVLAVPAFIVFVIMVMSLVWLPSRLLPAWYLHWRAQGRPRFGHVS